MVYRRRARPAKAAEEALRESVEEIIAELILEICRPASRSPSDGDTIVPWRKSTRFLQRWSDGIEVGLEGRIEGIWVVDAISATW